MRLLILAEGTTVPATRFRALQFLPHWEAAGIRCDVRYGYGDRYNSVSRTRFGNPYKLLTRMRRAVAGLDAGSYDAVFIQRPAIPDTAYPEEVVTDLNPNTIFDFDDAIWLAAGGVVSEGRMECFRQNIELARNVIAGNEFLAGMADASEKTTIIPTVIDTDRYVPDASKRGGLTIGWMGTSGNFPFLERLVQSQKRVLANNPNVTYRMVSNADFLPLKGHPQVEQIRWTADSEIGLLQSFDIGLMPLVDSPQTRGKCAFKMIQYMAVGTPVVVSDVGANREVHEGSGAGFLLESFDWDDALQALIDDAKLRSEMGEAGRQRAVDSYSIHAVLPQYIEIFDRLVS